MYPSQGLGNPATSISHTNPRRPGTSRRDSARPGTSFGQDHPQGQQTHHTHYGQYGDHYGADQFEYGIAEEEYAEESEDEDVFAFLPPSTADAAKEGESTIQAAAPAPNFAPVANAGAPAPPSQVYYYPTLQAQATNNPFAYAIPSSLFAINSPYQPPFTADTHGLPPPMTMDSSMEGGAFAYEPPANAPHPSRYPYPIGPPPVSPPSSDMDSLPSTGYGHAQGSDALKLEKIRSSSEHPMPASGREQVRKTGVIDERDEGEAEATTTSSERRRKDEEDKVAFPLKDEGEKDAKGLGREVPLGIGVDVHKVRNQTDPLAADLERASGDGVAERKISRGRKKSRGQNRSSRKSGGGVASGNAQRDGDAPSTEGEATGLRKRKNVNAGPYLNYHHLNERHQGGRSGRETARTTTSRVTTSPTSPTSGTTVINESIHSAYPLARRRSLRLDSAAGPENADVYGYGHGHRHDDSIGSSYVTRQKRRSEDDSMVDSLSFDGGRAKGEFTEDDEDDEEGSDEVGSIKMEFDFDTIDEEDSPYPEVRASVSNVDDTEMPALTIRMWIIGLILCMTSTSLNVFFNLRNPAPAVIPLALLLISYPMGKFLAYIMPIRTYRVNLPHLPRSWFPLHQPSFAPFRLFFNLLLPLTYDRAFEFSFNPGPWNIKEHVLVYIMANVAVGNPYAINAIIVAETYYHIPLNYWFSLTLILATQLTGFGLAGLTRRFLVNPASMVWPQNLVCCTLLNTLHAEDEDDGIGMYGLTRGEKGMTRYRFFVICTIGSFLWWMLPGYLFKALSTFSFVCWLAPNNIPVNQLFGVENGLGMSFLTFDWTRIAWIGSPLMVPWWAEVNIFVGFVFFFWILVPALYYSNTWQLAYFPISGNGPYDRFGAPYSVSRVLTPQDYFDESAYFAYSPLYLPATYAMTYLIAFGLSTCVIVHTLLYHGRQLYMGFMKIRTEEDDIHTKLMKSYKEVPDWWFAVGFASFFGLAVVAVEVWDTGVPIWSLLLAIVLPIVYILPNGFIFAMTGQAITINLLAQIIPGTLLPGKPFANMVFKAYSVQTLSAATSFVQDLKLGHYIKVAPRATFLVQMIGTALAAFVQVGVKRWIFANIPDVCSPTQSFYLTCPYNQVFFTASAVWGLIGPARQFGTGSIYHPHLYALIGGAFLPIPFWLYQRRNPSSWVRYISTPVVLTGVSKIPPSTGINYSSWFLVGFVFQFIVRRKNFSWWGKFNYVLSSALDSGAVIAVILTFFALQFPKSRDLVWWGNLVFEATADHKRTPLKSIPSGGLPWALLKTTATSVASATASAVNPSDTGLTVR